MNRIFINLILVIMVFIAGCDLQPKISSIPDSVGDFISERYPTLLAEPDSDIYKTAVADYGFYASPDMYGNGDVTTADYVLYSSADDYLMPAQDTEVAEADVGMPDEEETEDDVENTPDDNVDDLMVPAYEQQEKVEEKPVENKEVKVAEQKTENTEKKTETANTKIEKAEAKSEDTETKPEMVRAPIREITVEKGDTLYSISRKYSVPVNDLAVMNKISAPFALSVGQKLKVPDILSVPKYEVKTERVATAKVEPAKSVEPVKKVETPVVTPKNVSAPSAPKAENKVVENKPKAVDTKKTTTETKNTATKTAKTPAKTEVKKDTKSQAKKTEVKKDTKKAETKKTDVKPASTTKKAEAKKTETKKTTQKTATKSGQSADTKKRSVKQLAARSSSKFSWPVRGRILSGYGSKTNGLFNDGINIKAARGTSVAAAENGFVAYAGNEVKGMGNLVIIQHADGWMTVYAHMDSMTVRRGSTVLVGQKIGTVGTSGKVDQSQLHFEIRKGTKAYNPVNYLKK